MINKKKKKKRLKLTGVLFLLLFFYLVGYIGYSIFTTPIKHINIKNNDIVLEKDIIKLLNIDSKTPLYKVTSKSIKNKLTKNNLIEDVDIKKTLDASLVINIKESKLLFYNLLNMETVLSSGKTIKDNSFVGVPVLVNYVPSKIYQKFIKAFSKVDSNIIYMISEIEYNPDTYNDVVLDEERFLLKMNDGNKVYVNNANIKKLNDYQTIIASLTEQGTLYLDSNSKNNIFITKAEEEKRLQEEQINNEEQL